MGKLTLGLGFGVGYVLGARAGKDRYQQIVQSAQGLLGRPEVQQTISKARDAAPAPLQGSIDKLTASASGGQSGGGQGSGGRSSTTGTSGTGTSGTGTSGTGTVGAGMPGVGTGIPDTEALAAEAAVIEEVDVVVTPPTPTPAPGTGRTGGTGGTAGSNGAVPDPLIPPAKSDE